MTREEHHLIVQDIQQLIIAHWHEVDRNWGRNAHDDYMEDGSYTTSLKTRTGRKAIEEFYSWREDRGARVARHVVTNIMVTVQDADHASAISILAIYAADGEPVLVSKPPIMLADLADHLVRDDGRWKFKSRTITPLFRDDTPTTG